MIKNTLFILCLLVSPMAFAQVCNNTPAEFKNNVVSRIFLQETTSQEIKSILDSSLDFDFIAQKSLNKHWEHLKKSDKQNFTDTLKILMVQNYTEKFLGQKKVSDFIFSFVSSKAFSILTTVTDDSIESEVKFLVTKTSKDCWKISDIIIDEVSVTENYKEQFTTVLKKDGFNSLLKKMIKKVKT